MKALKNDIKLMKIDCGDLCDTSINAELRIHTGKYSKVIFKWRDYTFTNYKDLIPLSKDVPGCNDVWFQL